MTKNLEKADTVVKLTLAVSVIVCYGTNIISGPLASVLAFLAALTILIFGLKFLHHRKTGVKSKS
ncbi:MAG: hypothetical protein U0U09_00310 [Cyclobacteriaceae bacterium]